MVVRNSSAFETEREAEVDVVTRFTWRDQNVRNLGEAEKTSMVEQFRGSEIGLRKSKVDPEKKAPVKGTTAKRFHRIWVRIRDEEYLITVRGVERRRWVNGGPAWSKPKEYECKEMQHDQPSTVRGWKLNVRVGSRR